MLRLLLFASLIFLASCHHLPNSASAKVLTITGLVYPQAPLAEGDYTVSIKLADVSKMDITATVLAETTLSATGLPLSYSLSVDAGTLDSRMSYALQARVSHLSGELVAINDTVHPFIVSDNTDYDILVRPLTLKPGQIQRQSLNCAGDIYTLAFYGEFIQLNKSPRGNRHILPRVRSASGEKYQQGEQLIFLKGSKPPIVKLNGQQQECQLSE
ncbi:YbaY family lipoprotein [Oceanicoccus sagamiensis]|uniref:C-type lysozyme inhibitor domain-containing protein n=1 Tax=Oceanicoccus sagamiensis TaxID=716816 RepID=A0A1X9NJW1_9GAMM|nr:YbaY family lipoprotein [Oceanicoccus sagamiensis]ARN75749.1 hypothetical protein BST96_17530 [Oceanicoccus sagamiensis]